MKCPSGHGREHGRCYGRHRLTFRLLLLFGGSALLLLFLLGGGMRFVLKGHFQDAIAPHMVQYLEYVQQDIGSGGDRQRAQQLARELNVDIHIFDRHGAWSTESTPLDLAALEPVKEVARNGIRYRLADARGRHYLLTENQGVTMAFGVRHPRADRGLWRIVVSLLVLLLVLMLLYHFTRRLFAPIEEIRDGLKRYGAGDLDWRIRVNRRDELGALADSFNDMADDIKRLLDAKRQLLLAVSHELRSPLTRARLSLELMDDTSQGERLRRELDEIERLVSEILEAERLDGRHRVLQATAQDLAALLGDIVASHFPQRPVITEGLGQALPAIVDAARIRVAIRNLLENALCHNSGDGPPVQLALGHEEGGISIRVRDHGEGIAAEHLPHLTEPFYRADPSRQRQTGGYGLGLYLARVIAEAHGGRLDIDSRVGEGTEVRLWLPARPAGGADA